MAAHLIAEEGPHAGLIFNLELEGEWTIGRDPDEADLVLEDSTVSRKHAQVIRTPEGIFLKNVSRVNPTRLNDEEFEGRVHLKEGDRVQIGNTTFLFSEEAAPQREDDLFEDLPDTAAEDATLESPATAPSAYDTIFEDVGEELPFSNGEDTPYVLKVIAGPNAGAEIGIAKGRSYTIGKDPNACDIAFQDMSVSRTHARLTLNDEGAMTIEDLGSKNGTSVNSAIIAEATAVAPQELIALGTTIFLILDREAPQETIYSPMTPSSEEKLPEEPAEEARDWKREPIPTRYLILAGSVLAIFLIAFVSFFSLFKTKGVETVHKEPSHAIEKALAKFPAVQFSFNPASGKLFLVGHVSTSIDYAELFFRIGEIPLISDVEDVVVIDESVVKEMNEILSNNEAWRAIAVGSPQAGTFIVQGYLPTSAEAVKLSEYLTLNFPYLESLDNRIVVEEVLRTQLQGMLTGANLGAVQMQLTQGNVVLSGRYSEDLHQNFEELLREMQKVQGVRAVQNFAVPATPQMAAIDISQQYEVSGATLVDGRGYNAIINGKIYVIGDALEGMQIADIAPHAILLEKDGLRYRIEYGN